VGEPPPVCGWYARRAALCGALTAGDGGWTACSQSGDPYFVPNHRTMVNAANRPMMNHTSNPFIGAAPHVRR
jgi:hypothetical protein